MGSMITGGSTMTASIVFGSYVSGFASAGSNGAAGSPMPTSLLKWVSVTLPSSALKMPSITYFCPPTSGGAACAVWTCGRRQGEGGWRARGEGRLLRKQELRGQARAGLEA